MGDLVAAKTMRDLDILLDFFLHPSADPGQVICNVLLNENNYERWAKLMRNSLKAKNKLGFLDGVITEPKKGNDLKLWGIVNSMLVAWILNTIEPNLRGSVSCSETAYELWNNIRDRFSVGNEPRIYELQAAVNSCKQNKQTVQDYFGKMKLMWDGIDEFEPIPECCCGVSNCKVIHAFVDQRDKQRRRQFLMGLDASRFGTIRSNILCMNPPPSLNAIFSMVAQEERHQQVTSISETRPDVVGFSAQTQNKNNSNMGRGRGDVVCSYCGRNGHPVQDCYQLHGFPETRTNTGSTGGGRGRGFSNWNNHGGRRTGQHQLGQNSFGRGGNNSNRGRGGRGSANHVAAFNVGGASGQHHTISTEDGTSLTLSNDQVTQLVQLLNTSSNRSSDRMSGIVIDTGASHHLT